MPKEKLFRSEKPFFRREKNSIRVYPRNDPYSEKVISFAYDSARTSILVLSFSLLPSSLRDSRRILYPGDRRGRIGKDLHERVGQRRRRSTYSTPFDIHERVTRAPVSIPAHREIRIHVSIFACVYCTYVHTHTHARIIYTPRTYVYIT